MSEVQLYLGDCLDFMRTLPVGSVDAVVTDPPYGIGFAAQPTKWQRRAGHRPRKWDNQKAVIDLSIAPLFAIWGGNYYNLPISRGWLAWVKPDAPPSMGDMELCWTNQDMIARTIIHSIGATNAERVGHPTQKPLRVMKWCLDMLRIPLGATVLDPFMGSGTTGVACMQTGRNFIGCEIDAGYFKIAEKRIKDAQQQPLLPFGADETQPKAEQIKLAL